MDSDVRARGLADPLPVSGKLIHYICALNTDPSSDREGIPDHKEKCCFLLDFNARSWLFTMVHALVSCTQRQTTPRSYRVLTSLDN